MQWLEHKIPPPIVALLLGAVMWGLARFPPSVQVEPVLRIAIALVMGVLGIAVAASGAMAFRRANTTTNPLKPETASALVVDGIYRYTRNPMYLGVSLVLAGWAVYLDAALAWLGPVVFVLFMTRFQIIPEERALAARFGPPFIAYKVRVRRWF